MYAIEREWLSLKTEKSMSSFDRAVEAIIQDAMRRGEFDNLPNKGKPLDLDAYFDTPEDMRLAYSVLKNAGFLPAEAELLREIAALQELLDASREEELRKRYRKQIEEKRMAFALMVERQKKSRK
jgi:hypothetical protein